MNLNSAQQRAVDITNSVVVKANPGTGKTTLIASKYLKLLKNGINSKDILCLTFTNKAQKEMEERIKKLILDNNLDVNLTELKIFTFHSYAMNVVERREIIPATFLKYMILRYMKEHQVYTFQEFGLENEALPGMMGLIKYLKTHGKQPRDLDVADIKGIMRKLYDDHQATKPKSQKNPREDVELFAYVDALYNIFDDYETQKSRYGYDYSDLLIEYDKLTQKPHYKYVLVDELQDVNYLEAKMAREAGDVFFAVGDAKQAIMAFQGGSIENFELFKDGEEVILSDNYRSSNEILTYARDMYNKRTASMEHINELQSLRNPTITSAKDKVKLYKVAKDEVLDSAVKLIPKLSKSGDKVAVIGRTNDQLDKMSRKLTDNGITHTTTYEKGSEAVKQHIIEFIDGFFTKDPQLILNSFFTPFAPISLEDAVKISNSKPKSISDVLTTERLESFYKSVTKVEDINTLFTDCIFPISMQYGDVYYETAQMIYKTYAEAFKNVNLKTYDKLFDYMRMASLDTEKKKEVEEQIVLTTIHKAKGKEYDHVIYAQYETIEKKSIYYFLRDATLQSLGIGSSELDEEEALRLDFVAVTRAKETLHIISKDMKQFVTDDSVPTSIDDELDDFEINTTTYKTKQAFALFVNKDYDKAKDLLNTNRDWLIDAIRTHFEKMPHLSFSAVIKDPYEYLKKRILNIRYISTALSVGSELHDYAEYFLKTGERKHRKELAPFVKNFHTLHDEILKSYPTFVSAEDNFNLPLNEVFDVDDDITLKGFIDAIYKDEHGRYLFVDWKTSRSKGSLNDYRKQLETYRRAYTKLNNIELDDVTSAVAFVSLATSINTGKLDRELVVETNPNTMFSNFEKDVKTIISWRKDPLNFCNDFLENEKNDYLWQTVAEQMRREM